MSIIIFTLFLIIIFVVSITVSFGKKTETLTKDLNWFLVAFSAGTTANTGFIVTGAVGMGYVMGVSALMLPFAWFIGDLIYWYVFPQKINRISHKNNISTISEFLTFDLLQGKKNIQRICSIIIVLATITYTIAQWASSSATFTGFYNIPAWEGILLTGTLVTAYCLIGGFRSSVYVDMVQGSFMLLLTVLTLWYCATKINNLDVKILKSFQDFFASYQIFGAWGGILFILGWSVMSIGFGLSQPHVVDKMFAGKSEKEMEKARWVYLFFVQITWAGMTFLGYLIKLVLLDISDADAEKSLSIFVNINSNEILKGLVVCGVFATIASTAASLIISTSNYIRNDILQLESSTKLNRILMFFVSFITISIALLLQNKSVFDLSVFAMTIGAAIAPAMIIKIFNFKHNYISLTVCLIVALISAIIWQAFGLAGTIIKETVIGILLGLFSNYITFILMFKNNSES